MAGPSGERCSSCYFYVAGRPNMAKAESDSCRRFPPVVTVYFDHWCGEWAPKRSEDVPKQSKKADTEPPGERGPGGGA